MTHEKNCRNPGQFERERESKKTARNGSILIIALLIIGGIIGSSFVAYQVIHPKVYPSFSKSEAKNILISTPSTEKTPVQKKEQINNGSEVKGITISEETLTPSTSTIKCLGADRKYSFVSQEVCDKNKACWTKILGSFPTDPEEIINCLGADGKYSSVPRKVCEDTHTFWDSHKPSSSSNTSLNSSSNNNSTSSNVTPTPTPTSVPWYLAGGAPTPLAAYQADGVADIATSQVNLVNPGIYDLVVVPGANTPTWDAVNGWTMSGNHSWDTGVVPGPNYSAIIRFSNQTNSAFALFGSDGGGGGTISFIISVFNFTGVLEKVYYMLGAGDAAPIVSNGTALTGVLGMAGWQGWRNGVSDGSKVADWVGTSTYSIYIGASNHHGTKSNPTVGNIQRFAVWDVDVSAYMPALSTAILN